MSSERPDEKDSLSHEIDAALDGVNLQDVDRASRSSASTGSAKSATKSPNNRAGDDRRHKRGTIVGVTGDDVFVEIGPRMQGVISLREFETAPKVGETYDFTLHGREDDLWVLSRKEAQQL